PAPKPVADYAPPWRTAPTPEHLAQLAAAKTRGVKIRRAYLTAMTSGITLGIFAALTFIFCLVDFSIVGTAIGIGMAVVTWFEFKGADEIKRLDPTAPRRLAINQSILGAMIFGYALYMLLAGSDMSSELRSAVGSDLQTDPMFKDVNNLMTLIPRLLYGSLI